MSIGEVRRLSQNRKTARSGSGGGGVEDSFEELMKQAMDTITSEALEQEAAAAAAAAASCNADDDAPARVRPRTISSAVKEPDARHSYRKHNGMILGSPACTGDGGQGHVRIRSVAEMLSAEAIMNKVGSWDEREGKYFTKERQMQSKMGYFQSLHQGLRFSPSDDYIRRQTEVSDARLAIGRGAGTAATGGAGGGGGAGAGAVGVGVGGGGGGGTAAAGGGGGTQRKKTHFGAAGADARAGSTVVDGESVTKAQLNELRRTHPLLRESPVLHITKTMRINERPLDIYEGGGGGGGGGAASSQPPPPKGSQMPTSPQPQTQPQPPPSTAAAAAAASPVFMTEVDAAPTPTAAAQEAAPALPKLSANGADGRYSSLTMQLKRTKAQVLQHGRSLDTVKALLELEGSSQLKTTITRIFANPKEAASISEAEYQKRQKQYSADRARMHEQQQEELKDQRVELEREIGHLLTAASSASAPGGAQQGGGGGAAAGGGGGGALSSSGIGGGGGGSSEAS